MTNMNHPYLRLTLLLCSLAVSIQAVPYILVQNTRPKCVSVIASRDTTVVVEYHAPDMISMAEADVEDAPKEEKEDPNIPPDQLSKRYAERYKKKLEAMKKMGRSMHDMSIVMQQRQDPHTAQTARDWRNRRGFLEQKSLGTGRLREDMLETHGSVRFDTGVIDGPVEICIQSMSANPTSPSRVALNITQVPTNEEEAEVKRKLDSEEQKEAKRHLSRMESELLGLERKLQMILNNADYSKEQEIDFHEQSIAMNTASQYWPIIHVVVLFITGFTQLNHIIRFFKSHHIG